MPHSDSPESLAARLDSPTGISAEALTEALDEMDYPARLVFVRSMVYRRHQNLWNLVDGHIEASLDQIVADDLEPGRTQVWDGKNSLVAFNIFQKRLTRPAGQDGVVWGFNEQFWRWFTGPGYFVGRVEADRGILYLDYKVQPPYAPPGWPPVKRNTGFPRGLVYGYDDEVRPVSRDVLIGMPTSVTTAGKQYFVATRGAVV
jgi:hypothetical protein